MARKTYPFIPIKAGDLARPYLPITITNPMTGKHLRLHALIDTGADECAIPMDLGILLGHDPEKGSARPVMTGGGEVTAWRHTGIISLQGFKDRTVTIDLVPMLRIPLLGVKSFLSDFVLTVDYPNQTITLED